MYVGLPDKAYPYLIPSSSLVKVSCDRYTEFLNSVRLFSIISHEICSSLGLQTELLSEGNGLSERSENITEFSRQDIIGFKECTFSWNALNKGRPRTSKNHQDRKQFKLRFDDEVTFKLGEINIIVGPTASGKVRNRL